MFVRAPRVPVPGSDVACHVFLDNESCIFHGKVAWAKRGQTPLPEAGIEFIDLSQSDRTALDRVLVRPEPSVAVSSVVEADATERILLSPTTVSRNSAARLYGVAGGLLGLGLVWIFGRSGDNPVPVPAVNRDLVTASRPQVSPLVPSATTPAPSAPAPAPAVKTEFPFAMHTDGASTVIRVAYRGSERDAQVYRLVDPPGIGVRMPLGRVPASGQGHFAIGRDGIRHVWIEMREGILYVRFLPGSDSDVSAVIRDGEIVATVVRAR